MPPYFYKEDVESTPLIRFKKVIALTATILLLAPAAAFSVTFDNPLGNIITIEAIFKNIILWILGLSGFIALLAVVVGGTYIIAGGFENEQTMAKGKKILFWAIAGMIVIGMSATILNIIATILGFRTV